MSEPLCIHTNQEHLIFGRLLPFRPAKKEEIVDRLFEMLVPKGCDPSRFILSLEGYRKADGKCWYRTTLKHEEENAKSE